VHPPVSRAELHIVFPRTLPSKSCRPDRRTGSAATNAGDAWRVDLRGIGRMTLGSLAGLAAKRLRVKGPDRALA
jgi:hypothetical protein